MKKKIPKGLFSDVKKHVDAFIGERKLIKFVSGLKLVTGLANTLSSKNKGKFQKSVLIVESIWNFIEDHSKYDDLDYFDDWNLLMFDEVNEIIYDFINASLEASASFRHDDFTYKIFSLDDDEIGYRTYVRDKENSPQIYTNNDDIATIKNKLFNRLWQSFNGSKNVVMSIEKKGDVSRLKLRTDDDMLPLSSKIADDFVSMFKTCSEMNINRSLLLYGPPGTGKSKILQSIVDQLDYKSFRINLQDINQGISLSSLTELLEIFVPEAIIIDDVDRTMQQADLLATIETLHKHVKLILMSANNLFNLDIALRRPGRIDIIKKIESLDEIVIRGVVGDNDMLFNTIKEWPITYINEAVILSSLFKDFALNEELEDLGTRALESKEQEC